MTVIEQVIDSKKSNGRIFALIPAFNEATNIQQTVRGLPNFIDRIIIINDGSTDETLNKMKQVESDKLVLLNHIRNKGKGQAIITGFDWIKQNISLNEFENDVVILIDGDGQMNVNYIEMMVSPILEGHADFVKATRFRDKSHSITMPKFRYFGNQVLKVLNWISSGHWNISDPQNGYFALSVRSMMQLELKNVDTGYFFENSMLIETGKLGFQILEIPVPGIYGIGEKSNIRYKSFIPTTSMKLFLGWIDRVNSGKNHSIPQKINFISSTTSLLLFLYSIIISIITIFGYNSYGIPTFYSISVIFLLVGFIFDFITFKNRVDLSNRFTNRSINGIGNSK